MVEGTQLSLSLLVLACVVGSGVGSGTGSGVGVVSTAGCVVLGGAGCCVLGCIVLGCGGGCVVLSCGGGCVLGWVVPGWDGCSELVGAGAPVEIGVAGFVEIAEGALELIKAVEETPADPDFVPVGMTGPLVVAGGADVPSEADELMLAVSLWDPVALWETVALWDALAL